MKKIALLLDYDGCIGISFQFLSTRSKIDIKNDTSVIDENQKLWAHILKICKQQADLELVTIVPFSNRQNALIDARNSYNNANESFFLALTKIERHLAQLFVNNNIRAEVKLSRLLITDVYHKKNHGDTFDAALKAVDDSGKIQQWTAKEKDQSPIDATKILLLFTYAQAIDADIFFCIDDHEGILKAIHSFYNNLAGRNFIPLGIQVTLCHYVEGQLENQEYASFVGTGVRHEHYAGIVTQALNTMSLLPKLTDNTISYSDLRRAFYKIVEEHSGSQTPTYAPTLFAATNQSAEIYRRIEQTILSCCKR